MGQSAPLGDRLDKFFEHVTAISKDNKFSPQEYSDRILHASRGTAATQRLGKYLETPITAQKGTSFDGVECRDWINTLTAATVAMGISNTKDDANFKNCINEDEARKVSNSHLANLLPSLYGDHLNSQLQNKGHATLKVLCRDDGFVKGFFKAIHSKRYSAHLKFKAGHAEATEYGSHILFISEYFKNRGLYQIQCKPGDARAHTEHGSAPGTDKPHASAIIHTWCTEMMADSTTAKSEAGKSFVGMVGCASHIYAPDNHLRNSAAGLANFMFTEESCCASIKKAMDQNEHIKTLAQTFAETWDTASRPIANAIKAAVTASVSKLEPPLDMGSGGFDEYGGANEGWMYHTVTRGEQASAFLGDFLSASFVKRAAVEQVNKDRQTTKIYTAADAEAQGGCFAPGTTIMTLDGARAIEELQPGTRIVSQQGGNLAHLTVEDLVCIPGTGATLYGFNDMEPFFTSNHVFVTTTGLRAIDPELARMKNPWLDVAPLKPGHSVLQLTETGEYHVIPIERFSRKESSFSTIYDISIKDEVSSYHANGFLVYCNLPENTPKQLADAIRGLSPSQQAAALRKLPELAHLFERFGSTTIMEALRLQIQKRNYVPDYIDQKLVRDSKPFGKSSLSGIFRTWTLADTVGEQPSTFNRSLPTLSVVDNVLYVDEAFCERVRVKPSCLLWTRELEPGLFEHGYCKFTRPFFKGSGALFYSSDSSPDKLPAEEGKMRFFNATYTDQPWRPTPSAPSDDAMFEVSMDSMETAGIDSEQVSVQANSNTPFLGPKKYTHSEIIKLQHDRTEWNIRDGDAPHKSLNDPQDLFEIGLVDRSSELGLNYQEYRVPVLDQLRDVLLLKAQEAYGEAFQKRPQIYESSIETVNGKTMAFITMKDPSLVSFSADQYEEGKEPKWDQEHTFKNLGLDLKLPFIFSRISLEIPTVADPRGAIRVYNSFEGEFLGARHAIAGTYKEEVTVADRLEITHAVAPAGVMNQSRLTNSTTAHLEPAAVFAIKSNRVQGPDLDPDMLADMELKSSDVLDTSQKLIWNAMLYHMDSGEREKFLSSNKPVPGTGIGNLPHELASSLEAGTAKWLKETYAKAVIALQLHQNSVMVKDLMFKFEDSEYKRIRYWWTGKGQHCLSRDTHYNRLNQLAATYAVRRLCPRLNNFLIDTEKDDKGRVGGEKWAHKLFNGLNNSRNITKLRKDAVKLQHHIYILQALQPIPLVGSQSSGKDRPLCYQLADKVLGDILQTTSELPKVESSTEKAEQDRQTFVMGDAMQQMIIGLLEGRKEWAHIQESFKKAVDGVKGQIQGYETMQTVERSVHLKALLTQNLSAIFLGVHSIWDKWTQAAQLYAGGGFWQTQSVWTKLGLALDFHSTKYDVSASWRAWVPVAFTFVMTGICAYQLYDAITSYSELSPTGKAKAILSCVRQTLVTLSSLPGAIKTIHVKHAFSQTRMSSLRSLAISREFSSEIHGEKGFLQGTQKQVLDDEAFKTSKWAKVGDFVRRSVKVLLALAAAALAIICFIELVQNWGKYESGQWLLALSVGVQILQASAEMIMVFAGTGALGRFCAIGGPILAIAGLVLSLVLNHYVKMKREPTDMEKWIRDEGKPWVAKTDEAPSVALTWAVQQTNVKCGKDETVTITGKNDKDHDLLFTNITTMVSAGGSPSNLFAIDLEQLITGVDGADPAVNQVACSISSGAPVKVTPMADGQTQVGEDSHNFVRNFNIIIENPNQKNYLKVPKGATLTLKLRGKIAAVEPGSSGNYVFNMKETWRDSSSGAASDVLDLELKVVKTT